MGVEVVGSEMAKVSVGKTAEVENQFFLIRKMGSLVFFEGRLWVRGRSGGQGKNNFNQGRRRDNERAFRAQRDDSIRCMVYVSDIDQNVIEEQLVSLLSNCGQVVDCRVCGDPHSVIRFAFVEFADEEYNVSYVYLAMFAYFDRDNVSPKGLAKFFKESSIEERVY